MADQGRPGWLRRAGSVSCGAFAAAAALGWAAGSPVSIWHRLIASADPNFDQLLTGSAALVAWTCLASFCVAVSLEVAGRLPGAVGRRCSAIAIRVSPRVVRRLAQATIGISVLAGPISGGSAWAATAARPMTTVAYSGASPVSVDRPLGWGSAVALEIPPPSAPATRVDLDRPAASFVASPPAPPSRVTQPGPAVLITGNAHREAAGDTYVVRQGDALWDIAARHLGPGASAADIAREWPRWYGANRAVIGLDPNLLRPGELLSPPAH